MIFHPPHFHGFRLDLLSGARSLVLLWTNHPFFRFFPVSGPSLDITSFRLPFLLWNLSALPCTPSLSGSFQDPSRFFHPCLRALRTHPSPSGSPPCSSSGAGHFAPALPLVCQFRYHSPLPALAPPAGRFAPVPVPIKSSSGLSAGTLTCPSFVPRGLGT